MTDCWTSRTRWEGDEDSLRRIKDIKNKGQVNSEGYVNVAAELGLSSARGIFPFQVAPGLQLTESVLDTSTYHQIWVRAQRRRGKLL